MISRRVLILLFALQGVFAANVPLPFRFTFDRQPAYSAETGFGFEQGNAYFSIDVAEGNYAVAVTLGGVKRCETTVKAESRRLMLEAVVTEPGQTLIRHFAVNVRNYRVPPPPENAPGGDRVRLNPREQGVLHWDDKLTLEFNGTPGCVQAVEVNRADIPTIFLAGDSTVTDQPADPTTSWGQMLTRFFRPEIAIANHAESGETMRSFITGLRLDKILSQIKPGDWLFIQFGHNDMKENWPQTYAPATGTYKLYLKLFIAEVRRKGATPVLVTSVHRRSFGPDGRIRNTLGEYPEAVRQTAREESVALVDLNTMSAAFYEALGPDRSPLAFGANGRDGTHHSAYGAYELARCVVEGIRSTKLDLAKYVIDGLPPFDPAHPDPPENWKLLPSPRFAR